MVQLLWEETHVLKVVGLIPGTVYWMNIKWRTNGNICLKKTGNKQKEAENGLFENKFCFFNFNQDLGSTLAPLYQW